jgi:hypothetical protein
MLTGTSQLRAACWPSPCLRSGKRETSKNLCLPLVTKVSPEQKRATYRVASLPLLSRAFGVRAAPDVLGSGR